METKIKLSAKQKEIIKCLQQGYKLTTSYSTPTLYKNGISKSCTYVTLDHLIDLGLLQINTDSPTMIKWHLTELGKTIDL